MLRPYKTSPLDHRHVIVKYLVYRIIALLLGFSVALGAAEMAVRVWRPQEVGPSRFAFDRELGEIPVPRQKGQRSYPGVYEFNYSNNSQGFRGSREYGPKQPGSFRLLLLGDSFTYGIGVNDDQTFACHLEQSLRQHQPATEVINAGCAGKGTDYALKLFQTRGAKLQPEVTVLCFFPNDFQDNARGEYYDLKPRGGLQVKSLAREGLKAVLFQLPGYNWLISRSQAANLVKQAMVDYLTASQASQAAPASAGLVVSYSYAGQRYSDDANRQVTEIYAAQLMAAARQAGSQLVFFYIPVAAEVEDYRRAQELSPDEQAIKEIIETRGGTLHSLTPVLAGDPGNLRELYFAEGHWTSRAHLLAGRYLGNILEPYSKGNKAEAGR